MTTFENKLNLAAEQLTKSDPVLAPIIQLSSLATFRPHQDYYGALVNSIIGQQLSVKAAASIKQKFKDLFDQQFPTPDQILEKSVEDLRAVGFSRAKANYVHDLAQHITDGQLDFANFDRQSNQAIIDELTSVKGIGDWTAHMFLIFSMGRLDILPVGDLGIKNGIRRLYNLQDIPSPEAISKLAAANHWHPYESVAAWYVWRSLENEPEI
jgi:DNA-3-methyladenine glycosylase II